VLSTAWYRFVATWRRLVPGYVALILIVGLGGGLALGSVAAARRTASSFSVFLASTNPSDLLIEPAGGGSGPITPALDRKIVDTVAKFPHVRHVESYVALGASYRVPGSRIYYHSTNVLLVGSLDDMLFNQDRFTVTAGHRADPRNRHQVELSETAAQALGLHVGQHFDVFVNGTGGPGGRPFPVTVAGIGLLNREVVQDQIERFPTYVVATPALTRALFGSSVFAYFGVQVDGTPGAVAGVERDWTGDPNLQYFTDFQVAAQTAQEADQSIRPEALALGAFGCIAGLTTLLLALEELARQRRDRDDELRTMRSLGAPPAMTVTDGLIGAAVAILVGGVLAAAVAIALSPAAPIGPARAVYPDRGFAADWTVLGLGTLALVGLLLGAAIIGAALSAPHRLTARRAYAGRPGLADAVFRWGVPPSTAVGARFALDAGRGRDRGSTRWVLVGAVTALLVVSATLTFGHSLQNLVAQPSLYGWNWDYAVQSSDGYGPIPQQTVQATLHRTHGIAESGVYFASLQLDGVEVPTLLAYRSAPVAPPIVSGHSLEAKNQIVLGSSTMAQLHKQLGDTVAMRYVPGFPRKAIRLTIVGVATMPAIGIAEGLHSSMGVGAIIPADNGRLTEQLGPQGYPGCNGPNMVFLRSDGTVSDASVHHAAQDLATAASLVLAKEPASNQTCDGYQASVLAVQRPAQIVNYRSMGLTPLLLALALAAGATLALGMTLIASVRRRRHELAILKAIGFTPGQLQWSVVWQAGIVAVVGIVVGVPLGLALGRWLWTLFAEEIGAVPAPVVPTSSVVVACLIALALAVALSAVPGRIAARTPAASALTPE
jgi:putative ABC transport system permease protein